jgi:pyrophosphatase PpaX
MQIKAVIFDMDGTLVDTIPMIIQVMQEVFLRHSGRQYSPDEIIAMFGPTEDGLIAARVAEDAAQDAIQHYFRRYEELHEEWCSLFPGVRDLLEKLHTRGVRMGIVTGKGPVTAGISMRALGLDAYIDGCEPGSPNGAVKPAAIRKLLAGWGIPPEQAAYVGDMPYDMRAAHEAGVLALAAAWAGSATVGHADGADQVFLRVDELVAWLMPLTR